jgi:hypothetical protein
MPITADVHGTKRPTLSTQLVRDYNPPAFQQHPATRRVLVRNAVDSLRPASQIDSLALALMHWTALAGRGSGDARPPGAE